MPQRTRKPAQRTGVSNPRVSGPRKPRTSAEINERSDARQARRSSTWRSLVAGLAAFGGYGGWAFLVNADHGFPLAVRALLVQGTYSFVLTLSSTLLMEYLYRRLFAMPGAAWLTVVITVALLFTTAYGINLAAGTPEIVMTILPGFLIGSGYTVAYVFGLSRSR